MVRGGRGSRGGMGHKPHEAPVCWLVIPGENIEPGSIEEAVLQSPLIQQLMLVGQVGGLGGCCRGWGTYVRREGKQKGEGNVG